jgi:4-aminobutyrate aminotransferase
MVVTHAEGSWLYSDDGQEYLDWTTGIGVCNLGHCHPKIVKAAQEQMAKVMHAQVNISYHQPMLQLIQRMQKHLPSELDTFFFWNSGAEAVEAAVKLARQATGRPAVCVVQGSYHGRTIGTMSMTTSKTIYSAGFHPLMPAVFTIPFPYATQLHHTIKTSEKEMVEYCLQAFTDLLDQSVAPSDLSCVIVEGVLGEGGYIAAPESYLRGIQEICKKHGILFVIDDVQAGFGRAGKMFSFQRFEDLTPDVLIFAKGVANGLPLSGIVSRKELMDKQPPGSMGGTYAGNAVACAAALAVLDVFEEENVLENVAQRSVQLKSGLQDIAAKYDLPVEDIRATGLMVAIEFKGSVPKGTAGAVSKAALKRNLLVLPCSKFEVLRFIPALNISEQDMKVGLERIEGALAEVFGK